MIGKVEVLLMRPLQRGPARRITTLHAFALPVGDQAGGRGQVLADQPLDLFFPEALDGQELDLARPAVVAGRDCRHERLLAGGAAAALARAVAAEVGVVHLDPAVQALGVLPSGHHGHDLLLQGPGVGLLDAEPAAQLDRADPVLGGGDQPHGQEPGRERQLGGVEDRARGERDLVAAGPALDLRPGAEPLALGAAARGADEALRPPELLDHRPALLLGAVGLPELRLAQAAHPGRWLARHPAPPSSTWGKSPGASKPLIRLGFPNMTLGPTGDYELVSNSERTTPYNETIVICSEIFL